MFADCESVLPRYVKCSTASSACPSTYSAFRNTLPIITIYYRQTARDFHKLFFFKWELGVCHFIYSLNYWVSTTISQITDKNVTGVILTFSPILHSWFAFMCCFVSNDLWENGYNALNLWNRKFRFFATSSQIILLCSPLLIKHLGDCVSVCTFVTGHHKLKITRKITMWRTHIRTQGCPEENK